MTDPFAEGDASGHAHDIHTHAQRVLLPDTSIASPFEEEHPHQRPPDTTISSGDGASPGATAPASGQSNDTDRPAYDDRHQDTESDGDGYEPYDDGYGHGPPESFAATAQSMVASIASVGRRIAARAEQERSAMGLGPSNSLAPEEEIPLFDADTEAQPDRSRPSKQRRRSSAFSPPPPRDDVTSAAYRSHYASRPSAARGAVAALSPRDRALWQWVNIVDLDAFLREAYSYYYGKGFVALVLAKVLGLATFAFVVIFSTFIGGCLDYSKIRHNGKLEDIVIPQCFSHFSFSSKLLYVFIFLIFCWQVVATALQIPQLWTMRRFYTHVLDIPDSDVASISWNEVVNRLSNLRTTNPIVSLEPRHASSNQSGALASANGMDAHDVANRIMRQENFLIALFNKDVPDLHTPLSPHLASWVRFIGITPEPILTRSLLWNLKYCLLDFLFDENGVMRKQFLSERYREPLIRGLRHRFYFMALVNTVCSPFIVLYVLIYSFLRYFEEYHKDPSNLGSRQYTEWARWKFREFNELPHLFKRRIHRSYPAARRYINQFPQESVAIIARFVAFVAGAFTAVLLLASLYDSDLFLHFYLGGQRSVLFYVSVFATITAVARGMIPEEHLVFDPDQTLTEVVDYIHYLPAHWVGHFHSAQVHQEFGRLCQLKISLFVTELWSVLLTPFILWRSLPQSASAIIDFFRNFTVHVEGLGYVCAFADFNLERNGSNLYGAPEHSAEQKETSKEGKLEQSVLNFKAAHPDWQPHRASLNLYLSRMSGMQDGELQSSQGPAAARVGGSRAASLVPRRRLNFTPMNSVMLGPAGAASGYNPYPYGAYGGDEEIAHSIHLGLPGRPSGNPSLSGAPKAPPTLQAVEESQGSLPRSRRTSGETGGTTQTSRSIVDEDFEDPAAGGASLVQEPTPQMAAAQAGVRGLLDQMYLAGPGPRRW